MRIIFGGRGSGKSTKLANDIIEDLRDEENKDKKCILVVPTQMHIKWWKSFLKFDCNTLFDLHDYERERILVMTFDDYISPNSRAITDAFGIYFDDLDQCLPRLHFCPIKEVTINNSDGMEVL